MRVSYSSLSTYENCPLKYKYAYIERLPRIPSPALSFGQSVHEALRWFYDVPTPHPPEKESLLEYLSECWVSDGYESPGMELKYYMHAMRVLELFHRQNANDFSLPAALEHRFSIDLGFCVLNGVIDRLDRDPEGNYEVIDYKTSRRLPPRDRLRNDLQLPLYNIAVEDIWGIRPGKSTYYYLVPNQKFSRRYSASDISGSRDRIRSIVDKIEAGSFEPRENALCPWCDFRRNCPVFEGVKKPERTLRAGWPPDIDIGEAADEFIRVARRRASLEERALSLEEYLVGYLRRSGTDRVEGYVGTVVLDESGNLEVIDKG